MRVLLTRSTPPVQIASHRALAHPLVRSSLPVLGRWPGLPEWKTVREEKSVVITATSERTQYDIQEAIDLHEHLMEIDNKFDRVQMLHEAYEFPYAWCQRNVDTLTRMSPESLIKVLQHSDPTGEKASRRADMAVTA